MSDIAIGIDLGTTNSCVAIVENGSPRILPGAGGALTTPSIVCVDERGNLIVGHQAKRRFLTHPQDTIYGAKRLMGRRFGTPEMEDIQSHFFYEVVEGEQHEPVIRAGGKEFRLEEISAVILGQLKDAAQEALGKRVDRAVISVPAYFTQRQREAVRTAGEMAELDVLRVINEPTAAALAYGFGKRDRQRILVYDLGGGTFDVTVLQLYEEVYEVVGTGGDSFLGGIDFDNRLVQHLVERFQSRHGIDLSQNKVALQRLRDAAERAKIDLSSVEQTQISLPFLATTESGESINFDEVVTRKTYYDLTKPLVLNTLKIVERTLREAGLEKTDVDDIIFVGGMTRAPLVSEMVTKYFGKRPRKDVHPDEVVAAGAAILAEAIQSGKAAVTLADVLPVSIGIGVGKGEFRKIINKNTALPTQKSQMFRTTRDNQTGVAIRIYQGESRQAANNEFLGELRLRFPARPKGEVQIEIGFAVDQESILAVTARDSVTGKAVEAEFQTETAVARERYRADQILGEQQAGEADATAAASEGATADRGGGDRAPSESGNADAPTTEPPTDEVQQEVGFLRRFLNNLFRR